MSKFLIFKYKDGTKITQQWDELFDGKWKYGEDVNEKEFIFDYDFPYYDNPAT